MNDKPVYTSSVGSFYGDLEMPETMIAWIYDVTGIVAGLSAFVALSARKGGGPHRYAGRIFFWSMLTAIACAVWASLSTNENLILLFALLSGYLVISGYRALYLKRSVPRGTVGPTRAGPIDKGLAQFILIACCAISAWGMMAVPMNVGAILEMGLSPLLMSGIGLAGASLALGDMRRFRRPSADPHQWLMIHVSRMLAGATAAAIAVSVDYLTVLPEIARWSVLLVAGCLSIAIWLAWLRRRIKREKDPRAFLTIRIAEHSPDLDDL